MSGEVVAHLHNLELGRGVSVRRERKRLPQVFDDSVDRLTRKDIQDVNFKGRHLENSQLARAACAVLDALVDRLWERDHESRRCSRDIYPESYITKCSMLENPFPPNFLRYMWFMASPVLLRPAVRVTQGCHIRCRENVTHVSHPPLSPEAFPNWRRRFIKG